MSNQAGVVAISWLLWVLIVLVTVVCDYTWGPRCVNAFVLPPSIPSYVILRNIVGFRCSATNGEIIDGDDSAALSAFADSLAAGDDTTKNARTVSQQQQIPSTRTTTSTAARQSSTWTTSSSYTTSKGIDDDGDEKSWQASLEKLLDPMISLSQRQVLLTELLNSNQEIQESVLTALRDRKLDPILTPTGRKLQDGTRAVARQLTNDILPALANRNRPNYNSATNNPTSTSNNPQAVLGDVVADVLPKVGSRILNALSNQIQRNLETLQGDLANPSRIPARITQQAEELVNEARNVFSETPVGLQGPQYKVVQRGEGYEIRDYEGYTVASATVGKVGEPYSMDDVTASGAAFNTLAAYLFGANSQGISMEMTTPVTTTSLGEMRFYLKRNTPTYAGGYDDNFPTPLNKDNSYDTGSVQLVYIPPTRLAVRRFTGFVTEGEVTRQKDVLLTALELDGIEIDVPHGSVVPHVIFQYNPPYTIPMVRRNEIAVPIVVGDDSMTEYYDQGTNVAASLEREWNTGGVGAMSSSPSVAGGDDIAPSDV